MKKRLLSLLLALVMIVGMLPAMTLGASAATTEIGSVKAVGSGYQYNTSETAYAPTFDSLAAYDTNGKLINVSGIIRSTAFYTEKLFTSSAKLRNSPAEGVTYYFSIYVDLYTDAGDYGYGSIDEIEANSIVTIPGFKVEFYSFMEREMGSYIELKYAATRSYKKVGGVTAIATGVAYNSSLGAYAPTFAALYSVTDAGVKLNPNTSTGDYKVTAGGFYDSYSKLVWGNKVTSAPAEGDTVYSYLTLDNPGGNYELLDELINISIPGYTVEIISSFERDMGFSVMVVYSATRSYKQVGGVKANATDVAYNSELGGYAPVFSTLHALSVDGNKLSVSSNGDYKVQAGCFYDSYSKLVWGNKVTSDPAVGDTVYSYLNLDNPGGNYDLLDEMICISIEGYEVEIISSFERDMGFSVMIVYSAKRIDTSDVFVGGVGMVSGDYLATGATSTTTTKPSGGYAYYKDGTLTLNNYSYEGAGYTYDSDYSYSAVIYSPKNLTINLVGTNTLVQTREKSDTVYVMDATLTVGGNGKLTSSDDGYGLCADKNVTINGGTIVTTGQYNGIRSEDENIIINGGTITAFGRYPISAQYGSVIVNGGTVTATVNDPASGKAIDMDGEFKVASTLKIQAAKTVDGTLGTYNAEELSAYKKIVIKPAGPTIPSTPSFPDVPKSMWCYEAVEFAAAKGYFTGYKSGKFGPSDKITRQDFVVVLARISGVNLKEYSGRTGFPDVKAGDYYEAAVKWASSNGIVNGYNNGKFGVGDQITREQLVTILYNYAKKYGYDVSVPESATAKLKNYTDAGKITGYAKPAVIWALHNGIISGMTSTTIAPQNSASRAQAATILMNISKKGIMPI